MKYIFFLCLLALTSQADARCRNCFVQTHYVAPVVHHTNTIVVEKQVVTPVREVRYREIKGLRLVEDSHGNTLALVGNKVLNLNQAKTTSVVEEINNRSIVTERIITHTDVYGNQTVTVEKEISK